MHSLNIRSIAAAILAQPLALMLELSSSGLNSRLANLTRREYFDGGVPCNESEHWGSQRAREPVARQTGLHLTERLQHLRGAGLGDDRDLFRGRAIVEGWARLQAAFEKTRGL